MRERPDKLNNQAILLASGGEYTEAIACFKRAIIIERNNYLLWYNLGITYRDSGDLANARASLEKAHQIAPEKQDVLETLSTMCIQQEDYEGSLMYSQEGLENWPENPGFWNLTGVAFFNMEKYDLAS
ncbi:MAG: tetratricopeptide repeat protein [Treponema sp.]|nr:tetratricopeptide repeat protein [Treponema sp.]